MFAMGSCLPWLVIRVRCILSHDIRLRGLEKCYCSLISLSVINVKNPLLFLLMASTCVATFIFIVN